MSSHPWTLGISLRLLKNNLQPGGNVYPFPERSLRWLCSMVPLEIQYLLWAQCILCDISHMWHSSAQPLWCLGRFQATTPRMPHSHVFQCSSAHVIAKASVDLGITTHCLGHWSASVGHGPHLAGWLLLHKDCIKSKAAGIRWGHGLLFQIIQCKNLLRCHVCFQLLKGFLLG